MTTANGLGARFRQLPLLATLIFTAAVCAGGEVEATKPATKKSVAEEKPWKFESNNRRDPFSFRNPPTEIEKTAEVPGTPGVPVGPKGPSPEDIAKKREQAEKLYAVAEAAFLEISREPQRVVEALGKCDEGLKVFADEPTAGSVPEWQAVRGKLESLRKAADILKRRQDAEKKFRDSNLRLTGVVAREKRSQIIVNGKALGRGGVLKVADNYEVSVDEIRPESVIFMTPEGFKMQLEMTK
ncbi:MAG TPA: hypothetical protein VGP72_04105 [Planctomycetota bacterium]|jgi:hypothetical protein